MKNQDIAIIIVIAAISGVLSYFASDFLFASEKNTQHTVSKVTEVNPEFQMPSNKYYNQNSVNPTQLIQIGENNNENPFNSGQ